MLQLDGNLITGLVEKPADTSGLSDQRIVGILLLNSQLIDQIKLSPVEEYQLERELNQYAQDQPLYYLETAMPTVSLKYPWDLFDIGRLLLDHQQPTQSDQATIHPTALIASNVHIESGAKICEYAIVDGPTYIGPNAVIGRYSEVGEGSIIESGAELQRRVEVKRSYIGPNSHIHSGTILDSIIDSNVRIGAGFITANRRLDRQAIKVVLNHRIDTKRTSLGTFIGTGSSIGIHSGTNPGTIIGPNTRVLPGTIL
jgi:UDP-N-acetylglucosamine diphosphorylase / glucose-1-phosphate thymidylyltransferase / UDP-N-acetylgalactosamine diphosphorylase / glucosamine-1-phosphate N-acetyltransferase / galactosamine-1-phosphate N-acetyltransferase